MISRRALGKASKKTQQLKSGTGKRAYKVVIYRFGDRIYSQVVASAVYLRFPLEAPDVWFETYRPMTEAEIMKKLKFEQRPKKSFIWKGRAE